MPEHLSKLEITITLKLDQQQLNQILKTQAVPINDRVVLKDKIIKIMKDKGYHLVIPESQEKVRNALLYFSKSGKEEDSIAIAYYICSQTRVNKQLLFTVNYLNEAKYYFLYIRQLDTYYLLPIEDVLRLVGKNRRRNDRSTSTFTIPNTLIDTYTLESNLDTIP